jgi:uridine phosphorylase
MDEIHTTFLDSLEDNDLSREKLLFQGKDSVHMAKYTEAERPATEKGQQYHIMVKPGDLSRYVLLPGDPARVLKIGKIWDSFEEVASKRGYTSIDGKYKGVRIASCSTGIGGPSAAIALEELANVGCDTFIRVGSCGAIQKGMECGDLVISTGAVRFDGTTRQYIKYNYPALASHDIVMALIEACETLGYRYHVGITASTDSFYTGQGRPGFRGYKQDWVDTILPNLRQARVLNFEMEASTIFTMSSLFGLRAGAICTVFANRITNEFKVVGEEEAGKAASEAVKILADWDKLKGDRKHFYPGLLRSPNKL